MGLDALPGEILALIVSFVEEQEDLRSFAVNFVLWQEVRRRQFRYVLLDYCNKRNKLFLHLVETLCVGRVPPLQDCIKTIRFRGLDTIVANITAADQDLVLKIIKHLSHLQEVDWEGPLPDSLIDQIALTTLRHLRFQLPNPVNKEVPNLYGPFEKLASSLKTLQAPSQWVAKILEFNLLSLTTFAITTPISPTDFEQLIPKLSATRLLSIRLDFATPNIPISTIQVIGKLKLFASLRELELTTVGNAWLDPYILKGLTYLEALSLRSTTISTYKKSENDDGKEYFDIMYEEVLKYSIFLKGLKYMFVYGAGYRIINGKWICDGWVTPDCTRISLRYVD
jgi:hypothetical protein